MSTRKITKIVIVEPEDAYIVPANEEIPLRLAKIRVVTRERVPSSEVNPA